MKEFANEACERNVRHSLLIFILVLLSFWVLGCAEPQRPACEYICPKGGKPPVDCYCVQDALD